VKSLVAAVAAGVVLAPAAHADPSDDFIARYAWSAAPAVCNGLFQSPNAAGILATAFVIERDTGWNDFQAGEVIALAVADACPQLLPLLRSFAHPVRGSVV